MKTIDKLYYFGCITSGHGVHLGRQETSGMYRVIEGGLDTGLLKKAGVRDVPGQGTYVQDSGYSILTFWDRSGDSRPNSNSAFFALGEHTADELVAAARERYPHLFERFNFEIRW
jgi:hypothetical protein